MSPLRWVFADQPVKEIRGTRARAGELLLRFPAGAVPPGGELVLIFSGPTGPVERTHIALTGAEAKPLADLLVAPIQALLVARGLLPLGATVDTTLDAEAVVDTPILRVG